MGAETGDAGWLACRHLHEASFFRLSSLFLTFPSLFPVSQSHPFPMSANERLSQLSNHIKAPQLAGPLLANQVAIITGAGQGIGRAAALLFAQHGAKVVVSDLDGAKADEVVKLIKEASGDALAVQGNVMDANFGEKLIKATVDKYGKINHIVNNAGFTNDKMLHNLDDATFQQMLECHSAYVCEP